MSTPARTRVLSLAPWVDFGGSDKGTIDWFRWIDRSRYSVMLATTQPSANRRLDEIFPFADEVWPLPDLMAGQHMPTFIFDLIAMRGIEVLHIMNSRLGYELLADLGALPHPPKVVVQLHVEEEDRSGYVRLVARRYGNLVDAFSVSSEHLAVAVAGYDVAPSKIHVIPTGVDAEDEFSPDRVRPVDGLADGAVHVLYPGRLVEQKDPLLFCDVATRAVALEPSLRFEVVGEGPLEPEVRRLVEERGLDEHVHFHPPTNKLGGWFAACDLLLMTSRFEGVPYVAYEAMAMGLPVVAPALAGNVELLGDDGGALIEPRDDADAYARALADLATDATRRRDIGERSRARTLSDLSVMTMARRHEELYESLLSSRPSEAVPAPALEPRPPMPAPARLAARPRRGQPLVSIVVPCFNDGRYLGDCIASVRAQTWPQLEIHVVDDASTDAGTLALLSELERSDDVSVLRMPANGGPSAARNAALERVRGRYVLPVDADNMLLPDAVEQLVELLADAREDVGFIYPNLQYFGNRRDYFEAPAYSPYSLLQGNYCDTCSLFDAHLFADGLRFADIRIGHEDWDLVLQLAEMGVRGERARFPTLLYRKSGFTRSDTVEYSSQLFSKVARARHPALYGDAKDWGRWGSHAGPALAIKAASSPGLSLIALRAIETDSEAGHELRRRARQQTCGDFELLTRADRDWPAATDAPKLRRLPAALAPSPAAALADACRVARAPYLLITAGTGSQLLEDRTFVEKLLRVMLVRDTLQATVLCDAGAAGRYPLRRLDPSEAPDAEPHTILLRRDPRAEPLPDEIEADPQNPVVSLARSLAGEPGVEWRHHAAPARPPAGDATEARETVRLAPPIARTAGERVEREERFKRSPAAPALAWDHVRRWVLSASWMPPETLPLVRHRKLDRDERIVTNDRTPPPGYVIEFDLGVIHRFQPPGTAELRAEGAEGFLVIPDRDDAAPRLTAPRHPDCLGFLEQAAFPLLDALERAFHPASGQWVLLGGPEDPLLPVVEQRQALGFLEAYPNHPRLSPTVPTRPYGLRPLHRTVDTAARRHRYGVGTAPPGSPSVALGALHAERRKDSVPLWLPEHQVTVGNGIAVSPRTRVRAGARWAAAPLAWRGEGPVLPRARAAARRSVDLVRGPTHGPGTPDGAAPAGYLWSSAAPNRHELHLAIHPVTGDQLLTPWPLEASDMGYGPTTRLGWVATVPSTEAHDPRAIDVPWASHFGRRARRS